MVFSSRSFIKISGLSPPAKWTILGSVGDALATSNTGRPAFRILDNLFLVGCWRCRLAWHPLHRNVFGFKRAAFPTRGELRFGGLATHGAPPICSNGRHRRLEIFFDLQCLSQAVIVLNPKHRCAFRHWHPRRKSGRDFIAQDAVNPGAFEHASEARNLANNRRTKDFSHGGSRWFMDRRPGHAGERTALESTSFGAGLDIIRYWWASRPICYRARIRTAN